MATARRGTDGFVVEPAHGDRNAQLQLGDELLDPPIRTELGLDAEAAQNPDLVAGVGAVAMALHDRRGGHRQPGSGL